MSHPSAKIVTLQALGALNPHPERVKAPWFQVGSFFDPLDLVQVRYEMLRYAGQDGVTKSAAAALFGLSRPTFYHLEAAFARDGISALLPRQRGPKGRHKLDSTLMSFIETRRRASPKPSARQLARCILEEHGVSVHPRSIERALAGKKKRHSQSSP